MTLTTTTTVMTTPPTQRTQVLPEMPRGLVTMDRIKAEVMRHYNIKLLALIGGRRCRSAARPRMVVMWLARRLTDMSYPAIGKELGGRDHSTVISGCRKVELLLAIEADMFANVVDIMEALKHGTQLPLTGVSDA